MTRMTRLRPPKEVEDIRRPFPTSYQRCIGRARGPLIWGWIVLVVVDSLFVDLSGWFMIGATVFVFAVYFIVGTPRSMIRSIDSPVVGRWRAVNSPATRVPSHGLHAYGQTYAIDLTYHPEDGHGPDSGGIWPPERSPEEYPSFGEPVLAPIDGTVVKVQDTARDHLSRTSWFGMLYLFVEAGVRELLGPGRILGNHIVIDSGQGIYVLVAHLRHRSIQIREGEDVTRGQPLGECGNSGNSTEPHVHVQMMDHQNASLACGLPFQFGSETLETDRAGLPRNGEAMVGVARSRPVPDGRGSS